MESPFLLKFSSVKFRRRQQSLSLLLLEILSRQLPKEFPLLQIKFNLSSMVLANMSLMITRKKQLFTGLGQSREMAEMLCLSKTLSSMDFFAKKVIWQTSTN